MAALFHRLMNWHQWPFYLFYFPISYIWLWYYLKARSFWFFTASNPTLAFGGFEGEGKSKMYQQLPKNLCPQSIYVDPQVPFYEVRLLLQQSSISYPFIVKPDIGMKGILFRKIENEQHLEKYHRYMPVKYIIQEFIDTPLEVSVFYCRIPGHDKGKITALIQKDLLEVVGDGTSTIEELMQKHSRAKNYLTTKVQEENLQRVLQQGERYCFSYVANLFHGASFVNLTHLVDEKLTAIFDRISLQNHFYYGRYDIKCSSIDELREEKFLILEFNGAGSVPNHIYTGTFTLKQAYKEILFHWQQMFEISRINHGKGFSYWGFQKGRQFLKNSKQHFKVLKRLDKELVL